MDEQRKIDLDQADEEILAATVSDEALEAAAGTEKEGLLHLFPSFPQTDNFFSCCVG